jgi:predicted transcriptional regulator of viral defense system
MTTAELLASEPVFSLEDATRLLKPAGGRPGTVRRLARPVAAGRVMLVTRGVYAVVPPGSAKPFQPDRLLVAAAARPDAVFSHHAALELLGNAHSAWTHCTAYSGQRRRSFTVGRETVTFLIHPPALAADPAFATRRVERRGRLLTTTGPERTLVEGFRRPALAGGLPELIDSARGFPVLDLELLEEVLARYDVANLWAAVGWFLERHRSEFHVPEPTLVRFQRQCPRSPQYVVRGQRGGTFAPRWKLIVPTSFVQRGAADEP